MFPRVLKFSDLSSGIVRLQNGEINAGSVNSTEDKKPQSDCQLSSTSQQNEEVQEGDVALENGLANGDVNSEDGQPKSEAVPFCSKSIQVAASTVGISSLSPEVADTVASELFYKVKELLFVSI